MIYRVPFGDVSGDGHGCKGEVWVSSLDINDIKNAQEDIKKWWGEDFFSTFLHDYEDYFLRPIHWQALFEAGLTVEEFDEMVQKEDIYWDCNKESIPKITSILDLTDENIEQPMIYPEACIKLFFKLITYTNNRIQILETCPFLSASFEYVGYGSYSCWDY